MIKNIALIFSPNEVAKTITALVLAAGSSSRMGQSKQLLKVGGTSLLRKTILTAIEAGTENLVVVLGAREAEHYREIADLPVETIVNASWPKGMGTSIKYGVLHVNKTQPLCQGLLVIVCDQPRLTSDYIKKVLDVSLSEKKPIAASFYADAPGTPALFHPSVFTKLLEIPDDQGAKKFIQQNAAITSLIEFPEGAIDIDTPQDWANFNARTGDR